jgi:septin family protein
MFYLIIKSLYPLAIVGSSELVKVGTKYIRGRQYEWGVVAVENESHCDFVKLREMILSTNMLDLIELTHLKHYSLYRANRLREIGFCDDSDDENSCNVNDFNNGKMRTIQDVYNVKRAELNEEIERKEREIKEEYVTRIKAKDMKLKEMEKEVRYRKKST